MTAWLVVCLFSRSPIANALSLLCIVWTVTEAVTYVVQGATCPKGKWPWVPGCTIGFLPPEGFSCECIEGHKKH